MPGTPTTRRSIPTLSGTADAVSSYPAVNLAQMDFVDTDAVYLSGTLAARASISGLVAGTFYYATDTALLYFYNGSVWETVMLAGAWVGLGLGTFVVNATGYNAARIRQEGDIAQLSGTVENGSGATISAGSIILTGIPTALKATADIALSVTIATLGSGDPIQLGLGGGTNSIALSSSSAAWPPGYYMPLEGLTYPLS